MVRVKPRRIKPRRNWINSIRMIATVRPRKRKIVDAKEYHAGSAMRRVAACWLECTGQGWRRCLGDHLIDTAAILITGAAWSVPWPFFLLAPVPESWHLILASVQIRVVYFHLVAAAHRSGDMRSAYPLARGTAPLLMAAAIEALLSEGLNGFVLARVVLTCAIALSMAPFRPHGRFEGRMIALALANALVIAIYTLVDGVGVRRSSAPFAYTFAGMIVAALFFLPTLLPHHGPALRHVLVTRWHLCVSGRAVITLSYAVVFWAMIRASRTSGRIARGFDFVWHPDRATVPGRTPAPDPPDRRNADSRRLRRTPVRVIPSFGEYDRS